MLNQPGRVAHFLNRPDRRGEDCPSLSGPRGRPLRRPTTAASWPAPGVTCRPPRSARRRQWVEDRATRPTRLSSRTTPASNMTLIVRARCGRGCRFCIALRLRPPRYGPPRRSARRAVALAGSTRAVGLLGAAVADHPELPELGDRRGGLGRARSNLLLARRQTARRCCACLPPAAGRPSDVAPESGLPAHARGDQQGGSRSRSGGGRPRSQGPG